MVVIPIIFKSRPWLKWTLLLPSWVLVFLILIIVSANNELNTLYSDAASLTPELRPPRNQTGALSYTRWDPEQNYRPVYSVCFKNLLAENNNLGIFKTALHKVVKIRGLELRFYRYTSPKVITTTELNHSKSPRTTADSTGRLSATAIPDIPSMPEDITTELSSLIKKIMHRLITPVDGWRVDIDLGNVSEVCVNNFDYKVFHDDDLFFGIQSRRAIASYKRSGIVLRGHVIITTADGSTLETNYVKWDIENQLFTVKGIYVINRNGVKSIGRNICVNTELNNIKPQHAKFKQKEDKQCFAKL